LKYKFERSMKLETSKRVLEKIEEISDRITRLVKLWALRKNVSYIKVLLWEPKWELKPRILNISMRSSGSYFYSSKDFHQRNPNIISVSMNAQTVS